MECESVLADLMSVDIQTLALQLWLTETLWHEVQYCHSVPGSPVSPGHLENAIREGGKIARRVIRARLAKYEELEAMERPPGATH
jgi:hypothetical protein